MKKVLLSIMMCFVLVGCGNKLTCTASNDEMESKVTFKMKDGKAVSVTEKYSFEDTETADAYCSLIKLGQSSADLDMDIKCSGKKITVKSDSVGDFYESTDEEGLIEELEASDFTCE